MSDRQLYAAYNAGERAVDKWVKNRKIIDKLSWIEAIPYGETRGYVKNVARNMAVYKHVMNQHYHNQDKNQAAREIQDAISDGLKRISFKL